MVTKRSSTMTSLVKLKVEVGTRHGLRDKTTHKSAPIVALYWLLKRLFTYWFMRDVFPTLIDILAFDPVAPEIEYLPAISQDDNLDAQRI